MAAIDPLTAGAVLLATAATDAVYVMFTSAVVARKRVPAATWSSVWYLPPMPSSATPKTGPMSLSRRLVRGSARSRRSRFCTGRRVVRRLGRRWSNAKRRCNDGSLASSFPGAQLRT
jgi:hypothetical protein